MKVMRKITKNKLLLAVSLAILILDLLALDDITTGNEPSYWEEWDILLFSLFFFGLLIYTKLYKIKKSKTN